MLVDLGMRASADYLAIVDYISDFSTASAVRFIEQFETALQDLRDHPWLGMSAADGSTRVLRFGAYYRLEYVLQPDRVFVLRVKHGRRRGE